MMAEPQPAVGADVTAKMPPIGADVTHLMPTAPPPGNSTMHAPTGDEPVTLGDLKEDPIGSIQRIGHLLKKDASDPKLWLSLGASYFGAKAMPYVAPAIVRGIGAVSRGAKAVGGVIEPGDVGIVSPRIGKAMDLAGRVREAMRQPGQAPVPEAPQAPTTSPVETVSGGTQPQAGPPPSPTPAAPPPESVLSDQATAERLATKKPNSYPDQKALNEEALARRRAEYQARASAPEAKLYRDLRNKGLSDDEARAMMKLLRGTMTDDQVAAEIAARKGNRSPTR